jgi:cytochrome c biogenesis protein CcmG, thiol:disulfide interchange protein DsbE
MNPQPKSSNGSALWIGVIVVVVVLGVLAVVFARGESDDDTASQVGTVDISASEEGTGPLPLFEDAGDDPAVGATIPSVTGTSFEGDEITVEADGQAKVLLFVAHWCPHCQREVPRLTAHLDENPMPDDVELITISTSVKPEADNYPPQAWLEDEGWSAPVIADDEAATMAASFGLSGFPYFVVVDADGKVVERTSGELTTEQFDELVSAAQGS